MKRYFKLEDRKVVEKAISEGLTYKDIQKLLPHFSFAGIKTEIFKNGGKHRYNAIEAQKSKERKAVSRMLKSSKNRRNFTPEEVKDIRQKYKDGMSINNIRTIYKAGWPVIHKVLSDLIEPSPSLTFIDRLTALEMQVEFLIEEIKELRKCQ